MDRHKTSNIINVSNYSGNLILSFFSYSLMKLVNFSNNLSNSKNRGIFCKTILKAL